jgi:ribokinase
MTARVAVVGHVEQVEFCVVDRLPQAGEIAHATDDFHEAAGGGAVAVVQLRKLAGEAAFFTALGNDANADAVQRDLERHGVTVHAARRDRPHRRCFTHLDAYGERTITVIGDRILPRGDDPLPWDHLARHDAVYFTAGDAGAAQRAREAEVLVATVRAFDALVESAVELDALVASANDPSEQYDLAKLPTPPRAVVLTEGDRGGRYVTADGTTGRWEATPPPGPTVDAYGCGDSFAAGLAFALGQRRGARRRAPPGGAVRRALPRGSRPVRHAASAAERAPQRFVGRLAGPALDEPPPEPSGVRLGRPVAAHVDPAAQPRRPGDLAADRDLRDRRVVVPKPALGLPSLGRRQPAQALLERHEGVVERREPVAFGHATAAHGQGVAVHRGAACHTPQSRR